MVLPHVSKAFQERGFYEDETWFITTESTKSLAGLPKRKLKLIYKPDRKSLQAFGQGNEVQLVKASLPALLHGHNGYVLVSQRELDDAMMIAIKALDTVALRGVPWTDTVRMDLCLNLPIDPDLVLPALQATRVLGLHAWAEIFEERMGGHNSALKSSIQTLQWVGKETRFSAYNKTRKVCKDFTAPYRRENSCLRLELRLIGKQRIARFLGVRTKGAIAQLDFFHLYRSLRHVLCKLPSGKVGTTKCRFKTLLVHCLALDVRGPSGQHMMDWYRQAVDEETFKKTSREIARLAMSSIEFNLSHLLPLLAPPEQVHVTKAGTLIRAYDPTWGTRQRIVREAGRYRLKPG